MSLDNPHLGAPHIYGELLKLGFVVARSTVAKALSVNWRGVRTPIGTGASFSQSQNQYVRRSLQDRWGSKFDPYSHESRLNATAVSCQVERSGPI